MSDTTPLIRQWLVLNQLSARRNGATVRELADEHGVNLKTIRRDIDALKRAGFQLDERVIEQGCKVWNLAGNHSAALGFNLTEAMALYLGRRFLEPLAGTHFWQGANSAFQKIQATLGEHARAYLDKLAAVFYQTAFGSDYSYKAEVIDALMQAIEDRKLTGLHYQSQKATEPVEYEVHPYGLAYHAGALYLVAWSADHREIRHFKIDRIDEVRPTPIQFPRPANFDITAHFAGSLGVFHGPNSPPRHRPHPFFARREPVRAGASPAQIAEGALAEGRHGGRRVATHRPTRSEDLALEFRRPRRGSGPARADRRPAQRNRSHDAALCRRADAESTETPKTEVGLQGGTFEWENASPMTKGI